MRPAPFFALPFEASDYLPYCEPPRFPAKRPSVPACRDPLDEPFLALAVAGKKGPNSWERPAEAPGLTASNRRTPVNAARGQGA